MRNNFILGGLVFILIAAVLGVVFLDFIIPYQGDGRENDRTDAAFETVPLVEDASHYVNQSDWTEWWYFNFIDETHDLEMFIMYILIKDTAPVVGAGGLSSIIAGIYMNGTGYDLRDVYGVDAFEASTERPAVSIAGSTMVAENEDLFKIAGETSNLTYFKASWDLSFDRAIRPYDPPQLPGEMDYLIYMPGADVTGTVVIDGVEYVIDGKGYHDHNWGAPPFSARTYNWATYTEPDTEFFVMFEEVENDGLELIAVLYGDTTVLFETINVTYEHFISDLKISYPGIPVIARYPQLWTISAENGSYAFEMSVTPGATLPLFVGNDGPYVINEHVANIEGTLKENGIVIHSFDGLGFAEYAQTNLRESIANLITGIFDRLFD